MDWNQRAREIHAESNSEACLAYPLDYGVPCDSCNAIAALAAEAYQAGQAAGVAEGLQRAHEVIGALIERIDYDVRLGAGMAAAQNEVAAALRAGRGE